MRLDSENRKTPADAAGATIAAPGANHVSKAPEFANGGSKARGPENPRAPEEFLTLFSGKWAEAQRLTWAGRARARARAR